jgi:outer membrane protein assembly factor BamB
VFAQEDIQGGGELWAISVQDGRVLWRRRSDAGPFDTDPTLNDDGTRLFVGGGGVLYAFYA